MAKVAWLNYSTYMYMLDNLQWLCWKGLQRANSIGESLKYKDEWHQTEDEGELCAVEEDSKYTETLEHDTAQGTDL